MLLLLDLRDLVRILIRSCDVLDVGLPAEAEDPPELLEEPVAATQRLRGRLIT